MITLSAYRNTFAAPIGKLRTWMLAAAIGVAGTVAVTPAQAAPSKPAVQANAEKDARSVSTTHGNGKLDNAGCQSCHDGKKGKLEGKDAEGEARELHPVLTDKFGKSVHSKMQCVECHTAITDSKTPHKLAANAKKPDCVSCHEKLWDKAKKENKTKEKPRLGTVVESIDEYKKSFHARVNKEDETRVYATCNECHSAHTFDIPVKGSEERAQWRLNDPKLCGTCHEDQLDEYTGSIHGEQLLDEENVKSAVCSDCHTAHSVGNTSAATVKQAITANCGDCHDEVYKSYERTRHGKLANHAGGNTIRCADCHGSHGIFMVTKLKDPRKMVAQDNKMCISCHDSDKKFAKFAPLKEGANAADKDAEKIDRPNLDELHDWLPNTKLHWKSVRCIDCHTSADAKMSHEILDEKKAERQCVNCHSKDSKLATRLYRHLAENEKQKYGFANSVILANSYVIGATRHPLLDTIIAVLIALTLLGVLGHGAIRYLSAKKRRNNAK